MCVTGVSGSGKSTLMQDVLFPALQRHFGRATETPGEHDALLGADWLGDAVFVDQSPIGKTARSNPASYVGAFDEIRKLFAQAPLAQQRGYGAGMFSFNAGDGRCPTCGGSGFEHVEMQFLSDVYLRCPDCDGKRFRAELLEVKIDRRMPGDVVRELNVADVLELTVSEAGKPLAEGGAAERALDEATPRGSGPRLESPRAGPVWFTDERVEVAVPNSSTMFACRRRWMYSRRASLTVSFFVRCPPTFCASLNSLSSIARFVESPASYAGLQSTPLEAMDKLLPGEATRPYPADGVAYPETMIACFKARPSSSATPGKRTSSSLISRTTPSRPMVSLAGAGSRVHRFRHNATDTLHVRAGELAILAPFEVDPQETRTLILGGLLDAEPPNRPVVDEEPDLGLPQHVLPLRRVRLGRDDQPALVVDEITDHRLLR